MGLLPDSIAAQFYPALGKLVLAYSDLEASLNGLTERLCGVEYIRCLKQSECDLWPHQPLGTRLKRLRSLCGTRLDGAWKRRAILALNAAERWAGERHQLIHGHWWTYDGKRVQTTHWERPAEVKGGKPRQPHPSEPLFVEHTPQRVDKVTSALKGSAREIETIARHIKELGTVPRTPCPRHAAKP